MCAGLIGGIAGSFVMGQFVHLWTRLTPSRLEEEGAESTTKAASAVSESIFHHRLKEQEKSKASAAVHFAFGSSMGAFYGAAAAMEPRVSAALGVPFGASLYVGAHAVAVPALGLSKPVM